MTALPDGVSILPEGRLQFITQRGYFAPPHVQCMLASLAMVLAWTGYDMPLPRKIEDTPPENFVKTLWEATGQTQMHGTTTAGSQRALQKLLPEAPIFFGSGTPDEVIDLLNNGAAVRVTAKCKKLTPHLKRWVGSYNGGHAFAIIGARVTAGVQEVFWLDPFGKPLKKDGSVRYAGEWIKWSDVSGILDRGADGIHVAFGYKSAAVPPIIEEPTGDTEMIYSNVVELSRGTVGAKTPVLHPETLTKMFNIGPGEVKLFGITPDGKYRGVLVRTSKIAGTNPKIALVDASLVSDVHNVDLLAPLQAVLDKAQADLADLKAKSDADVADAQAIVARH